MTERYMDALRNLYQDIRGIDENSDDGFYDDRIVTLTLSHREVDLILLSLEYQLNMAAALRCYCACNER